ncbi:MAG: hypothetical protein K2W95_34750 [Candidatus Obscuribacterales bacterium]|nr:hypothetical protein [Candidatus Obscuribacterales bacterium]
MITNEQKPMSFTESIVRAWNRFMIRLKKREKGQGIVEYFAILAFIAVLIAFVFASTSGTLYGALSQSFSRTIAEFNRLNGTRE